MAEWVIPSQELSLAIFPSYSSVSSQFFLLFLLKYLLMYYLFMSKMDKKKTWERTKTEYSSNLVSENWHWFWNLWSLGWFIFLSCCHNLLDSLIITSVVNRKHKASLRKHYFIEGLKGRKRFPLAKSAWYQPSSFQGGHNNFAIYDCDNRNQRIQVLLPENIQIFISLCFFRVFPYEFSKESR